MCIGCDVTWFIISYLLFVLFRNALRNALKKFVQRPCVRRTFRFSSRTPHAFNNFFYELYMFFFYNLTFKTLRNKTINNEIEENKRKTDYVMRLLKKIKPKCV